MQNENEVVVPETTEEVTPEVTTEESHNEETVEELRERLSKEAEARKKSDELANNYKVRAERAEKKAKESVGDAKNLSTKDIFALTTAKVSEEDIDEVLEHAKFKKISISEALKTNYIKTYLKEKEEFRNTANATNTNTTKRSNTKLSDEALIEKASKGGLPESEDEIVRLAEAEMALRKAKLRK